MATTWNAIFLGSAPSYNIDPFEGDGDAEFANQLVGQTFGSETTPLYDSILSVTAIDRYGAVGALDTARTNGGDQVRYTLPGATTPTTAIYEGLGVYNATITFTNGQTGTVTAVVFQDELGNVFLAPEVTANADSLLYQSAPLVSIRLNSLVNNNANLDANRQTTDFITCFVAGTMIYTPAGPRAVETLRAGDLVSTVDRGARPLAWTGSRRIAMASDNLRPVRIRAGALGQGLPAADLLVSQQHRILVRSTIARRMFDSNEVLVAAKQLVALPGIEIVTGDAEVEYVHLLFDRHELVRANGAEAESLFTGPEALKGVSAAAREEIRRIFPELAALPAPVRPLVKGAHGRRLAERHLANDKPVLHPA